jgi:hypothetical protein
VLETTTWLPQVSSDEEPLAMENIPLGASIGDGLVRTNLESEDGSDTISGHSFAPGFYFSEQPIDVWMSNQFTREC